MLSMIRILYGNAGQPRYEYRGTPVHRYSAVAHRLHLLRLLGLWYYRVSQITRTIAEEKSLEKYTTYN